MRCPSPPADSPRPDLLLPRFGLPAIAHAGTAFVVETLEPEGSRGTLALTPAAEQRRVPLVIEEESAVPRDGLRLVRRLVRAEDAPPGGYDLIIDGVHTSPLGARRAVWLRASDPETPAPLQVAHLTDLHVDRNARRRARLQRVVADINALGPDLVLVGGDLINNGDRPDLFQDASVLLAQLSAPMIVVPGNHDHGFHPRTLAGLGLGPGWRHFASAFHSFRHFRLTLSGWDFVGFDGGPSGLSPLVRTRGLDAEALGRIAHDLDEAHDMGRRGVVLLSHTPSRARLTGSRPSSIRGPVGRMGRGARAFEDLLRHAARRGQSVLHLSGHTHWVDVFEIDADGQRFMRWEHRRIQTTPQPLQGPVALINSQSASHSAVPFKQTGRGYGFTRLLLGDGPPRVGFHRYPSRP